MGDLMSAKPQAQESRQDQKWAGYKTCDVCGLVLARFEVFMEGDDRVQGYCAVCPSCPPRQGTKLPTVLAYRGHPRRKLYAPETGYRVDQRISGGLIQLCAELAWGDIAPDKDGTLVPTLLLPGHSMVAKYPDQVQYVTRKLRVAQDALMRQPRLYHMPEGPVGIELALPAEDDG